MTEIPVSRLRQIAIVVLLSCLIFIIVDAVLELKIDAPDVVQTLLAAGFALLVLAELGPIIRTFKVAGIEIGFVESVGGEFNNLKDRVGKLELSIRQMALSSPRTKTDRLIEGIDPPALKRPRHPNDQNKGRFGNSSEASGFKLYAEFNTQRLAAEWVQVKLSVKADPEIELDELDAVEFFLHETFKPDRVRVPFSDKKRARLNTYAVGGFTVGAWIPRYKIELELDLAQVRDAPQIIKER